MHGATIKINIETDLKMYCVEAVMYLRELRAGSCVAGNEITTRN
jgi:hypothetical protein